MARFEDLNISAKMKNLSSLNSKITGMMSAIQAGNRKSQEIMDKVTADVWKYERRFIHKWSGASFNALQRRVDGWRGDIYFDPNARSPLSHQRVVDYYPYEEARGYPHNAIQRTADYARTDLVKRMAEYMTSVEYKTP